MDYVTPLPVIVAASPVVLAPEDTGRRDQGMGTRNRVSVMVGVALLLPALASCQRSESASVDSRAEIS